MAGNRRLRGNDSSSGGSESAMTVFDPGGLPAFAQGIDTPEEIASDNLYGRKARLPLIKIMHAGAEAFKMIDGELTKRVDGIILDHSPARAWWEKAFDKGGGGNVPDCWSVDGLEPHESASSKQSESCITCPQNAWGSDPKGGRGKGCKEMARVHILIPDVLVPVRLTLPPSSLRNLDEYVSMLTSKGRHYNSVITRFDAIEAQNSDGIKYTQVAMHAIANSCETKEQYQQIKDTAERNRETMRGQRVEAEEMEPAPSAPSATPQPGDPDWVNQ